MIAVMRLRRVQAPIAAMLLPLAVMEIAPAGRRRIDANDRDSLAAVRVSAPALASVAAAVPSAPRRVLPLPRRRSGGVRRLRRAADRHGVVQVAAAIGVHRLADTNSAALHAKGNHPARALLLAVVIGVPTRAALRRAVPLTDLVVLASAVMAGAVPPIAVPRTVGVTALVIQDTEAVAAAPRIADGATASGITLLAGTAASTDTPIAAGTASAARIAVAGIITPRAVDVTAVAVRPTTSAIAVTAAGATAPTAVPMPPIGVGTVARRSVAAIMPLIAVDAADTVIMASAVAVLSITDAATSPASIAGKGAAGSLAITP
ncbi:MAG TPA: hypothetical protein VH643_35740 [Gemmataceae bacterium]|jgi:hypothetical protein